MHLFFRVARHSAVAAHPQLGDLGQSSCPLYHLVGWLDLENPLGINILWLMILLLGKFPG